MDDASYLRNKALSTRTGTACAALAEMIRLRRFQLSEVDLIQLEGRADQVISGWVFAYRAFRTDRADWEPLLRMGLLDANPRIREQVCDIIGDEHVANLREELKKLFDDPEPFVAEAAKYNYSQM